MEKQNLQGEVLYLCMFVSFHHAIAFYYVPSKKSCPQIEAVLPLVPLTLTTPDKEENL